MVLDRAIYLIRIGLCRNSCLTACSHLPTNFVGDTKTSAIFVVNMSLNCRPTCFDGRPITVSVVADCLKTRPSPICVTTPNLVVLL